MTVKVSTCKDDFEGEVVKGLLAANGIECFLQNENTSQIYGDIQGMTINVLVNEEDAEKAKKLLDTRPKLTPEEVMDSEILPARKSVGECLQKSLGITVFMIVYNIVIDYFTDRINTIQEYAFYALGIFVIFFLFFLFYYRWRFPKQE